MIKTLLITLLAVLGSSLSSLLAEDIKASLPRLTAALINFAVRLLPERERDEHRARWQADATQLKGNLIPVLWAMGLPLGSLRMHYDDLVDRMVNRLRSLLLHEDVEFAVALEMAKTAHMAAPIPSKEQINSVSVGEAVQICAGRERFWTQIHSIEEEKIVASVANDLLHTDEHGLIFGDLISFERKHILNIERLVTEIPDCDCGECPLCQFGVRFYCGPRSELPVQNRD